MTQGSALDPVVELLTSQHSAARLREVFSNHDLAASLAEGDERLQMAGALILAQEIAERLATKRDSSEPRIHVYASLHVFDDQAAVQDAMSRLLRKLTTPSDRDTVVDKLAFVGTIAAVDAFDPPDEVTLSKSEATRVRFACWLLLSAAAEFDPPILAEVFDTQFVPTTLGRVLLDAYRTDTGQTGLLEASIAQLALALEQASSRSKPGNLYNLGLAIRDRARATVSEDVHAQAFKLLWEAYGLVEAEKRAQYGLELAISANELSEFRSIERARQSLWTSLFVIHDPRLLDVPAKVVRIALQACALVAVQSEELDEIELVQGVAERLRNWPLSKADLVAVEFQCETVGLAQDLYEHRWDDALRDLERLFDLGGLSYRSQMLAVLVLLIEKTVHSQELRTASKPATHNEHDDPASDRFVRYCVDLFEACDPLDPETVNLGLLLILMTVYFGAHRRGIVLLDSMLAKVRNCVPPSDYLSPVAVFSLVAAVANDDDFASVISGLRLREVQRQGDSAATFLRLLLCQIVLLRTLGLEVVPRVQNWATEAAVQIRDDPTSSADARWAAWGVIFLLLWAAPSRMDWGSADVDLPQLKRDVKASSFTAAHDGVRAAILKAIDASGNWESLGVPAVHCLLPGGSADGSGNQPASSTVESVWVRRLLDEVRVATEELCGIARHRAEGARGLLGVLSDLALRAAQALFDADLREIAISLARAAIVDAPRDSLARNSLASGLINRALYVGDLDALGEVIAVCDAGLEIAEPHTLTEASLLANRGVALRVQSNFGIDHSGLASAVENLRSANEIGQEVLSANPTSEDVRSTVAGYCTSLALALYDGDIRGFGEWHQEAISTAREATKLAQGSTRAALAELVLARLARLSAGRDEEWTGIAEDALERAALASTGDQSKYQFDGERLEILAESALATGNRAMQEESLTAVSSWIEGSAWTLGAIRLRVLAGRLLLSLDRPAEALDTLQAAARAARSAGLAGVSEAHQTFWLRELSTMAIAASGAALSCNEISTALDELALARMVLLSSPADAVAAARVQFARRHRGLPNGPEGAVAPSGSILSGSSGKCLLVLVPGDRHGWRVTITESGHEVEPIAELADDVIRKRAAIYWTEYARCWSGGRVVPLSVALRFAAHLAAVDDWLGPIVWQDQAQVDAQEVGICLGGLLNSFPLLGSSFRRQCGVVRLAALDAHQQFLPVFDPAMDRTPTVLLVAPDLQPGLEHEIVEEELRRIHACYGRGYNVTELIGTDIEQLREEMEQADVIHIAAHCNSDPVRPMRSWIDLGQSRLEASEVARWNLSRSRCLILAACDTGAAGVVVPDEIYGFVGASLKAGVPEVVAASFPIPSSSTCDLMECFHMALSSGSNASEALRAAHSMMEGTPEYGPAGPMALLDWSGFEVHSSLGTWMRYA